MSNQPLTVLMINTFHHHRGGDSTYTFALTDALEQRGHTVVPFAMEHPANLPTPWARFFAPRVDVGGLAAGIDAAPTMARRLEAQLDAGATLLRSSLWNREAARRLEVLLREVRPDVAHLQHVHHHLTPAVIEPLERHGIPIVWTLHDYELLCPTGHFFRHGAVCEACRVTRFDQAVRFRCERGSRAASAVLAAEKAMHRAFGVLERVDRFIAPSAFLRDKLIAYGVRSERVEHLPNFLEPGPEPPSPQPDAGYVLFAGRLAAEKGAAVLIDAALAGLSAPVMLVGDGPERAALEARAGALVRDGRVRFAGPVPHAEMPRWLAGACVVVVPSIWYENFPFAVLEAFAAGRPVVASRIGGIPEQVEHGRSGILFPPGSSQALRAALNEVCASPALAARLGQGGYARIRALYGRETHLTKLESLYARLAAKR